MTNTGELDKDYSQASKAYIHAVVTGIVKIASKMGISTIQSYQGSKNFLKHWALQNLSAMNSSRIRSAEWAVLI